MSGGGGGDDIVEQQRQLAEEQRARRAAGIAQINTFFNGGNTDAISPARQAIYDKIRKDATDYQMNDLEDQRVRNARELTFQLARTGNLRSSTDADQTGELTRLYRKGALQAANIGKTASDSALSNDESSRLQAIQNVNADVDPAQALTAAQSMMRVNAAQAADQGAGASLGNVFQNMAYLYGQYQNGQGQQRAINAWNNTTPSAAAGGARPSYGVVR